MCIRDSSHAELYSDNICLLAYACCPTRRFSYQFASVANVIYPDVYQGFLDALGFFNFDLAWVFSAGCVVDIDFHDRLLV